MDHIAEKHAPTLTRLAMKKPTPAQRRVLENLVAGRAADFHCRTRSDHGGLTGTIVSLNRRGWHGDTGITDAGRAVITSTNVCKPQTAYVSGKTLAEYPALECPLCGAERKPVSLNKDGSVTYTCPPDHKHHGSRYTWRIDVDGNLID